VPFKHNVEKYNTAGQATDYNIIRRIHSIGSITQNTHTNYEIIIVFQGGKWSMLRLFAYLV